MNINMNTEYISKCDRYKLEIVQDDYSESPNEWGNEDMFLVYSHGQFTVQRDGFDPFDIYKHIQAKKLIDNIKTIKDSLEREELIYDLNEEYENYYIFPVAAYIHSGVSLSLTDSFEKQGFDTSVTGFVLIKKAIVEPDHESSLTWNPEKLAEEYAESLIDTWNTYLIGDVYGFRLYKGNKQYSIPVKTWNTLAEKGTMDIVSYFTEETEWEEIDSCWGFYSNDIKTNGILDHIDDNIEFEL